MLLCDFPFNGPDVKSISKAVQENHPDFDLKEFHDCTPNCIDMIKKLLEKKKDLRLSSSDALKHDWFKNESLNQVSTETAHFERALGNFSD
eukprot:CAMPEP_0116958398 /NCGR_PEP_ID=MMETSP0467-20121206/44614_1 /TAXON_ID=283647 /ORGANISM="Mesodinium pulex, Strain SPMC105" /LENGTH=90 /DNA_ID=CAMNT_0004645473 /DNA_START=636 /DNA_END=908 /DNA_ORIENTATION=-